MLPGLYFTRCQLHPDITIQNTSRGKPFQAEGYGVLSCLLSPETEAKEHKPSFLFPMSHEKLAAWVDTGILDASPQTAIPLQWWGLALSMNFCCGSKVLSKAQRNGEWSHVAGCGAT